MSTTVVAREDGILAWHFLPEDGCLANTKPKRKVVAGKTESVETPIIPCLHGLHGSIRIIDALRYAPGPIVCRTLHWGEVVCRGADKLASQHRCPLWIADASAVLHGFACDVAEEALDLVESKGSEIDRRSRSAIEVKRKWIHGEASDDELAAAWDAAWDAATAAARDAAWAAATAAATAAAGDAAWAAAGDAAGDAAWAVAWAAAGAAAWDAAGAAAGAAARAAAWDASWAAVGDAVGDASRAAALAAAHGHQNARLELAVLQLAPGNTRKA